MTSWLKQPVRQDGVESRSSSAFEQLDTASPPPLPAPSHKTLPGALGQSSLLLRGGSFNVGSDECPEESREEIRDTIRMMRVADTVYGYGIDERRGFSGDAR